MELIIAVTGASGAYYAKLLLETVSGIPEIAEKTALVMSTAARQVWKYELEEETYRDFPVMHYENDDMFAPPASGSAGFKSMIICPCSIGTLGRIAGGISSSLIERSADVMMKERRKLILVAREAPLSSIHIENMLRITQAGGIIFPAGPVFYHLPFSWESAAQDMVNRVLQLAGNDVPTKKWQGK